MVICAFLSLSDDGVPMTQRRKSANDNPFFPTLSSYLSAPHAMRRTLETYDIALLRFFNSLICSSKHKIKNNEGPPRCTPNPPRFTRAQRKTGRTQCLRSFWRCPVVPSDIVLRQRQDAVIVTNNERACNSPIPPEKETKDCCRLLP